MKVVINKTKKIQRRANQIYSQMWRENTNITITGESNYSPQFRINFRLNDNVGNYQIHICDNTIPVRRGYNHSEVTNSMYMASFVAVAVAMSEFGCKPENYASACNRCEIVNA